VRRDDVGKEGFGDWSIRHQARFLDLRDGHAAGGQPQRHRAARFGKASATTTVDVYGGVELTGPQRGGDTGVAAADDGQMH
jgi:hypothetical protein